MRPGWLIILLAASVVSLVTCGGRAATIGWGCDRGFGATDSTGAYLTGDKTTTADFSSGAYVQLVKQVGEIDPYIEAADLVDDIVLDEGHIGYYFFGSGSANGAFWNAGRNVDIDVGDVIYVRAYNVPKADVASTPRLEIGLNDTGGSFLGISVTQTMNAENYYFNSLRTEPIPEPASLLLLVPGLAVWALRRKK